jgi:hypothetical protein
MATTAGGRERARRRVLCLMAAGLVDSFALSLAWTVVVLQVTRQHGLVAAGVCSTAMLVGVALSAPTATRMAQWLDGRHLLRTAGGIEAILRLSVMALLAGGAPVWLLAVCVMAMNVVAWTGYAGMRAEVAAVSEGASGITWYGTTVAAVEAVGVAAGALVPVTVGGGLSPAVLTAVVVIYVGALLPTLLVAGGSAVPRAPRSRVRLSSLSSLSPRVARRDWAAVQGALLMTAASGPTLLSVALAAQLHGRAAVGLSAAAFTLGSLFAPALAGLVERTHRNHVTSWLVLAAGMVLGWALAAQAVFWLCVAQTLSGLCMTSLEGLLDTRASRLRPEAVTAALARATAARALGSSAATALLPMLVASAGLSRTAVTLSAALASLALIARAGRGQRLGASHRETDAPVASSPPGKVSPPSPVRSA